MTDKAAREMVERIRREFGPGGGGVEAADVHLLELRARYGDDSPVVAEFRAEMDRMVGLPPDPDIPPETIELGCVLIDQLNDCCRERDELGARRSMKRLVEYLRNDEGLVVREHLVGVMTRSYALKFHGWSIGKGEK